MTCHICGTRSGRRIVAHEMMFGLGDRFTYFECADCGCCQLTDPPADLRRYYPPTYYAFAEPPQSLGRRGWRAWIDGKRTRAQLTGGGGLWAALARWRPRASLAFLRHLHLKNRHARILDVGCGRGSLLAELENAGCTALVGVDRFLPADWAHGPRVRLLAGSIADVPEDEFDVVMFHHSLEHMPDSAAALSQAARRLRRGGTCLVRLPIASSDAWARYGSDWVELDAPRHFFLHTPRSLERVARRCGLTLVHTEFELTTMPYWGSEMYRRGLTLFDRERGAMRSPRSVFSAEEMECFTRLAKRARRRGDGGPAAFYFQRAA
jgi:SAM-dependent methyltransferase